MPSRGESDDPLSPDLSGRSGVTGSQSGWQGDCTAPWSENKKKKISAILSVSLKKGKTKIKCFHRCTRRGGALWSVYLKNAQNHAVIPKIGMKLFGT
jgi:hypothetical protein